MSNPSTMKNADNSKDRSNQVVIQFSSNPDRFSGPFDKYVVVETVLLNNYHGKEKTRSK